MAKIKVAVVGFGNVGQYALKAVVDAPDMEVSGIVVKEKYLASTRKYNPDFPVVTQIEELQETDVALLSIPSLSIPDYASQLLTQGISTVDSFDLHGDPIINLKQKLNKAALQGDTVSISAAGWDPGTNSLMRAIFQVIAPSGVTHTNFGPGMSMGHSVGAKKVDGIKRALSVTNPKGLGAHARELYVELEEGYELAQVEKDLRQTEYFKDSDLQLYQVENIDTYLDYGHGVDLQRKGVASGTHNQLMRFDMRITNPAVTAQVMATSARAAVKQNPGHYYLLEVPLIDMLIGEREENLHALV